MQNGRRKGLLIANNKGCHNLLPSGSVKCYLVKEGKEMAQKDIFELK